MCRRSAINAVHFAGKSAAGGSTSSMTRRPSGRDRRMSQALRHTLATHSPRSRMVSVRTGATWHNMFVSAALCCADVCTTLERTDGAFEALAQQVERLAPHPLIHAVLAAH